MIIRLPKNKTWTKDQDSDSIGSLVSTFNIDVTTNKGDTRVSPRMKIGTDDIADLGVATNFIRFNSTSLGFWTTAGSYVFKTTSVDASAAFAKDAQSARLQRATVMCQIFISLERQINLLFPQITTSTITLVLVHGVM